MMMLKLIVANQTATLPPETQHIVAGIAILRTAIRIADLYSAKSN